jgi:hypothetical protein
LSGRVPRRVDAATKAGLLDLIDWAIKDGWTHRAACQSLELPERRAWRWRTRRAVDRLIDRPAGGHPVHGLLDWEQTEILKLFDEWSETDRSRAQAGPPRLVSRPDVGIPVLSQTCSGCWRARATPLEAAGDLGSQTLSQLGHLHQAQHLDL